MCKFNKKVKQLALNSSPQELFAQFQQYDDNLKYLSFAGSKQKVLEILKEQKSVAKAIIYQNTKSYCRKLRKLKKG